MGSARRQLHLNAFLMSSGHHEAAWRLARSAADLASARNFGLDDRPAHSERYARAAEFVDVSVRLWDSWEDDAELGDKAAGVYAGTDRIHPIDYAGQYFRVRGPLNVPRSPQGWPLLVQAGSSPEGRYFAARYAEAVFTAQQTLQDGQEFYADMKERAVQAGRDPELIKIMPGIVPVLGSTEAEARALDAELAELITPEYGRTQLANVLEVPAGLLELDRPLPAQISGQPQVESAQSQRGLFRAECAGTTLREHYGIPRPVSQHAAAARR